MQEIDSQVLHRNQDTEQIKLLEILHYVMVGLSIGGMAFLAVHYLIMSSVMEEIANHPEAWKNQEGSSIDPTVFFRGFGWLYLFMAVWGAFSLGANFISGLCLRMRKSRVFSIVVAGFNCINFPFGTALGIFTLIVLVRSSVVVLYDGSLQVK